MDMDHELLTAADEVRLAREIEAGVVARAALDGLVEPGDATTEELQALVELGERAWQEMWLSNLRLVWQMANRHCPIGDDVDEYFQDGCLGLAEAILRWDHTRGTRFSTVAWPWIRHHLQASMVSRSRRVTSRTELRRSAQLRAVADELASTGRVPGVADLAEATQLSVSEVQQLSVARLVGLGIEVELRACPSAVRDFEAVEQDVPEWLWQLPEGMRRVLVLRFGLDGQGERSYASCARRLRCSAATVRRRERQALTAARMLLGRDSRLPLAA